MSRERQKPTPLDPLPCPVSRYLESIALGEVADALFERECRRRGLRPSECMTAPLMWLGDSMLEISGASH